MHMVEFSVLFSSSACGVFDKHYWPVACASLVTDSGDLQRFSCQAVEVSAQAAEPEGPEGSAEAADGHEIYMGDQKGMCLPCCDAEGGQEDCGGKMPVCPHDFSREQDVLVVPEDTEVGVCR